MLLTSIVLATATSIAITSSAQGCPAGPILVYFEAGDVVVTRLAEQTLNVVADIAKGCPNQDISVVGHSDPQESEIEARIYSRLKASRVKEQLVRNGLSSERISISGQGTAEPAVPDPDRSGDPQNRRVEIRFAAPK